MGGWVTNYRRDAHLRHIQRALRIGLVDSCSSPVAWGTEMFVRPLAGEIKLPTPQQGGGQRERFRMLGLCGYFPRKRARGSPCRDVTSRCRGITSPCRGITSPCRDNAIAALQPSDSSAWCSLMHFLTASRSPNTELHNLLVSPWQAARTAALPAARVSVGAIKAAKTRVSAATTIRMLVPLMSRNAPVRHPFPATACIVHLFRSTGYSRSGEESPAPIALGSKLRRGGAVVRQG
jgi:hypothetical protein